MNNTKKENLFTLILLVKGRDEFSMRWLKYMDEIDFKYPIVISDGANDGFISQMIKNHTFKNNIKINFKQFDTNNGFKSYYEMKRDTLKEIKSKYSMICDNDDFIIESGITNIINFLEKNNEYISASGKILSYEIDDMQFKTYGNLNFLPAYEYSRLLDPVSDWNKQINLVFESFQPNFYNIFKTEVLKKIFKEIVDLNFSDLVVNEFFIQLRSNTLGKSKILSTHHYLRQRGTSQISNNFDFSNDLIKKDLPRDFRKLNDYICTIISEQNGLNKQQIKDVLEKSFASYIKKCLIGSMLRYRYPKLFRIKLFLKSCWLEKLKFISSRIKELKNKIYLNHRLLDFENKAELIKIINFLKKNV